MTVLRTMTDLQFPFFNILLDDVTPAQGPGEEQLKSLAQSLLDGDFSTILSSPTARILLGHENDISTQDIHLSEDTDDYSLYTSRRLGALLSSSSTSESARRRTQTELLIIGLAALHAFLQSIVTGPPLDWDVKTLTLPTVVLTRPCEAERLRQHMLQSLTTDGTAVYALTPNIELFWLAKIVFCDSSFLECGDVARWARTRVNFWHQKLLSDNAATLQESLFQDLEILGKRILGNDKRYGKEGRAQFLLERAAINLHHGLDAKAREDLTEAARETGFQYALTGRLGKRTKFQEKELSQLVVLAVSADEPESGTAVINMESRPASNGNAVSPNSATESGTKPQNVGLNDDTLLDSISFSKNLASTPTHIEDRESLPPRLADLDPSTQPLLKPIDSIILLSTASAITNTSPQHGLTREETLPYATRVLEGGSNNWQIYTQALLVRSRIEGYRSRTVERGVLQLQALVDQVIAETTTTSTAETGQEPSGHEKQATTFLPRANPSESAPASERLKYIHQLGSPTRWELEAELAARWVSLGGLRTALEIYERLQMWAEAALCWAATDREDKARRIVRRQLYHSTKGEEIKGSISDPDYEDDWQGPERDHLPNDAPRLFCILGDVDKDPSMYERAWEVSKHRYARAQRSLGRYYYSAKNHQRAEEAYATSLTVNRLDHPTWFALGCVRLELEDWQGAVDAFSRTIQLDDQDAEAWSNLAAALLRLPPSTSKPDSTSTTSDEDQPTPTPNPPRHRLDALAALKRASALSHTSYRIWSNLLTVAASLRPPSYTDILVAQKRIIELRGTVDGEACIDADILDLLVRHFILLDQDQDHNSASTNHEKGRKTRPRENARQSPRPRHPPPHNLLPPPMAHPLDLGNPPQPTQRRARRHRKSVACGHCAAWLGCFDRRGEGLGGGCGCDGGIGGCL